VVFTLRMSRGVIRLERHGDVLQSRRARTRADATLLATHGRAILTLRLEGPLFFASAELLHERIDTAIGEGVRHVLLDIARVTELDSTGARILLQADERLRAAGRRLVLCGADSRPELAALLRDHGVADALAPGQMFPDLDRALEGCEDDLLTALRGEPAASGEEPFEQLELLHDVAPTSREALRPAFERLEFRPGEAVFHQGEPGSALYVIARGSASVWMHDGVARSRRLVTFSQGTFFGELAFLDNERRSATVIADEAMTCYRLEHARFERIAEAHPAAGQALLANLARELSLRMRRNHRSLLELD
jgi:anti-anti-sigma factor